MLPLLEEAYINTGKLALVYKEFPVVNGEMSAISSFAAQCAGQQDQFWAMHDWLFENWDVWRNQDSLAKVKEAARTLNLDGDAFDTCMDDQSTRDLITEDYREGQSYGIQGTPNFVINGHHIQGLLPAEEFVRIIDALLAEAESGTLPEGVVTVTPTPTPNLDFGEESQPALGDADAPVTIIEFTDYQCPFCRRHVVETMPSLREQYIDTGLVRYIVKDFTPTLYNPEYHPNAIVASEAANCAGAQDAYWPMHDLLFEKQDEWGPSSQPIDQFVAYAEDLNLDSDAFRSCVETNQLRAEIEEDFQEGVGAGLSATPSFFINGVPLVGAQPFDVFKQAIDAQLNP